MAVREKNLLIIIITLLSLILFFSPSVKASDKVADFIVDIGKRFYDRGDDADALHEFNKALILDPNQPEALKYKKIIESKIGPKEEIKTEAVIKDVESKKSSLEEKEKAISETLSNLTEEIAKEKAEKEIKTETAIKEVESKKSNLEEKERSISEALSNLREEIAKEKGQKEVKEPVIEAPAIEEPEIKSFESPAEETVRVKPEEAAQEEPKKSALSEETPVEESKEYPAKEEPAVEARRDIMKEPASKEAKTIPVKITGEARMSMGFTEEDAIWKRANADLNERNWRMLSGNAFNNYEDTYDPGIYDRLRFNVDTENASGLNFHTNVTVDPWSFTGKSNKITLRSANGKDTAEFEVLYWSNTGYTLNQTIFTQRLGDAFNLPEIKVVDGKISPTTVSTTFGGTFNIPELEMHKEFWPIREFWLDYKTDDTLNMRLFPMAYQDQALTSDDPLGLSNHHTWWEESPWLTRWKPGNYNAGVAIPDFTQGRWDDTLAFATRDSDGTRLTALRGFSFTFNPLTDTALTGTFASPKELWQDYESFDTFPGAIRLTHLLSDNFDIGGLYTYHLGLQEGALDATNQVVAADSNFQIIPGLKLDTEGAFSWSSQDEDTSYKTSRRGSAFYLNFIANPSNEGMLNKTYYDLKPQKGDNVFFKTRLLLAHMSDAFDPGLASYRETRDDAYWSRHISFKKPFDYYYMGLSSPALNWDDLQPFRIGDGVDTGRDVIGLRAEVSLFDEQITGLGDIRNVHDANHKYIENVSRTEWAYKITPKLTSKLFLLNQDMPNTHKGVDPFIIDPNLNTFVINDQIPDGADPSLNTGSFGSEYRFNDIIAINGVYERTNDVTVATDNFPRSVLGASSFASFSAQNFWQENMRFRTLSPYLYDQENFPLPPYKYFDIFKTGIQLNPNNKWEVYLDWTRNEFESAGQIDNNMNHLGLETSYMPTEKLGLLFKYVYSIANNVYLININEPLLNENHDNFYGAVRYKLSDYDQLMLEYGVGGYTPVGNATSDPFGGSEAVLDTQHIFRIYYTKKF